MRENVVFGGVHQITPILRKAFNKHACIGHACLFFFFTYTIRAFSRSLFTFVMIGHLKVFYFNFDKIFSSSYLWFPYANIVIPTMDNLN